MRISPPKNVPALETSAAVGARPSFERSRAVGLKSDAKLTQKGRRRKAAVSLAALYRGYQTAICGLPPVNTTLFSLAFVAASGVYVAAANHVLSLPGAEAATTTAAAFDGTAPASDVLSNAGAATGFLTPEAAPSPASSSRQPMPSALLSPPTITASRPAAPAVIVAQAPAATDEPGSHIAPPAAAAPLPPLPRPRPATSGKHPGPSTTTTTVADNALSGYRDGTYTGTSENAYYGRVQVRVTVVSHRIAAVSVLDYPQDRRTSRYINSQALPLLKQEVISANSASVDTVSGATLTSGAYRRSLANALDQAGGANA
jgi:uncharacterized protein with FMN-binding domain